MEDESEILFHGITEVLQAILLCDSQSKHSHNGRYIKVYISSVDDEIEDRPQLYSIEVTGNRGLDFKELTEGYFKNLTAVIKENQKQFGDGCLCVVSQVGSHNRTKQMFQVRESGNLQCFESKVLPTKPSAYLKICFQVVQGKEQMARECQKLHSFLLRVKMFNPQDHISFHLHLFGIYCDHTDICYMTARSHSFHACVLLPVMTYGNTCLELIAQTTHYGQINYLVPSSSIMKPAREIQRCSSSDVEYLTDPVCEKEMPPALVITPSYFLRNKDVPCSPVHVKHGVCVPLKHLAQTDFASPKLQATAILVPHRQRAKDQSHGFINLMFTYSGYIPVGSTSIPAWKPDVVGDIFHTCECQNCENPGPFQSPIQLHVVCTEHNFIMQRNSYVIYVVLDIKNDEHISQGSITKLYLLNRHRALLFNLFGFWKDELQLAIDSAVKSIWCPQFMVRNKFERTLSQAVPVTTDSILSIVTSSTDENFRQACFASLQVNNARDLRRLLSEKLFTLATDKYQCNADSEPHCQDSPSQKSDDQDSFDDLGVHEEGIETKADTNWESSNIEFYGNSDCTASVEPEPWTDHLLYTEQHSNLDAKDTNAKEDRESSSQEWYDDSHGDLDNWMEE